MSLKPSRPLNWRYWDEKMFRQLTEALKKFLLNVKFNDDIFQTDVMILYIA